MDSVTYLFPLYSILLFLEIRDNNSGEVNKDADLPE